MTATVSGAAKWKPQVAERGRTWQIVVVCPRHGGEMVFSIQPPPWSVPDMDMGDPREVERRRTSKAGIPHREEGTVTTQVWCHQCAIGAEVTVSAAD